MTSSQEFSTQAFSLTMPPRTLCLLRLSALGDITHVLPTLRTLQTHWPDTDITWIIGKTEYQLVKDIAGVRFIVFDKSAGIKAYFKLKREIKRHLGQQPGSRRFDLLLHMQLSLRASVASLFIPAGIKLGFDKARAKDLQSLFCNQQITPHSTRQHVVDSFLEFPRHFGLEPVLQWQLPVSEKAKQSLTEKLEQASPGTDIGNKQLFVINPCAVASSKDWRNWTDEGYAGVADFVQNMLGMKVVLAGGPSPQEKFTAMRIMKLCSSMNPIDMVGKTTIDEMVALLDRAEIVLAPDTGPTHIASALYTKTVGLYATTNPDRAGPYNFRDAAVNKYPEALLKYNDKTVEQANWGERIRTAEAMKLITVEDVIQQIEKLTADTTADTLTQSSRIMPTTQ
jgi:heptosyltransferase I